jgi:hypothetical protein
VCARLQSEYIYAIARDISGELRVEETLRSFLLTTRRAHRDALLSVVVVAAAAARPPFSQPLG